MKLIPFCSFALSLSFWNDKIGLLVCIWSQLCWPFLCNILIVLLLLPIPNSQPFLLAPCRQTGRQASCLTDCNIFCDFVSTRSVSHALFKWAQQRACVWQFFAITNLASIQKKVKSVAATAAVRPVRSIPNNDDYYWCFWSQVTLPKVKASHCIRGAPLAQPLSRITFIHFHFSLSFEQQNPFLSEKERKFSWNYQNHTGCVHWLIFKWHGFVVFLPPHPSSWADLVFFLLSVFWQADWWSEFNFCSNDQFE